MDKKLIAEDYQRLAKESLENIDYSKVDWDAELERHHRMHMQYEEEERLKNGRAFYATDFRHALSIATHEGVLTGNDIIKNIMRMIMMDRVSDGNSGYSAKEAIEEIRKLSWAEFSKLKKEALSYFCDEDWQKYFVRKHIVDGAELNPITEEEAFRIMDELSLKEFETWEMKDSGWDYSLVLSASNEVVDKVVEMCVRMFNARHIKTLDDVYGDTNCFDCGELPSVLFSNTDKLALLREGVAYYDNGAESRLTEYEMDKVIDECLDTLSSREVTIINARKDEETMKEFDIYYEIESGMRMYSDYDELLEIANIFAHQGIVEALAYKYEETSAKDMIPFHADNYLHTKYLTFGDALRDYVDYCSGIFAPIWTEEDDMSAACRFMDYWEKEKLNQGEIRGNYG